MPVFRLTKDSIQPLPETTFSANGLKERSDLQRLLKANIAVVAPDVLVIAEEFGEWEESRRRVDLLGVDREANLVVIELKRDEEGGHMELQAIRYAAMVSGMTFARAVEVHQALLDRVGAGGDARARLLEHLRWIEPNEDDFAKDVRIVLVSADFSKELTTSVLWLNERDMDIRCVRLKPYSINGEVIVDAQQVVPLPEAEEYTIRIKTKGQAVRAEGSDRQVLSRAFWTDLLTHAAKATPAFANISPGSDHWISASAGYSGLRYNYLLWQTESGVEFVIDRAIGSEQFNRAVFDYLHARKPDIEKAFKGSLKWSAIDGRRSCKIVEDSLSGGVRSARDQWPDIRDAMIGAMQRLEGSLAPHLENAVRAATGSG